MPYRQTIQNLSVKLPLRHESVDEGNEAAVMSWFQQMKHFVNDEIFQTFRGFLCQFRIEPDLFEAGLQLPHFVFILCTNNRFNFTPMSRSHLAIRGGTACLS